MAGQNSELYNSMLSLFAPLFSIAGFSNFGKVNYKPYTLGIQALQNNSQLQRFPQVQRSLHSDITLQYRLRSSWSFLEEEIHRPN